MKLDANVIVGANNETLLVRSKAYSLTRLAQDWQVLQAKAEPECRLTVGRSFADEAGREVMLEQIPTRVLQALLEMPQSPPALVRVEVWQATQPCFRAQPTGTPVAMSGFTQVGQFLLLEESPEDMLESAYLLSQNLSASWVPLKNGKGCRSTSVGDVLVMYLREGDTPVRQAYQVVAVGFEAVEFSPAA